MPRPRAEINMERAVGLISKGRILTFMAGVWAQELG